MFNSCKTGTCLEKIRWFVNVFTACLTMCVLLQAFASGSGLATHQLTHTGERKYICSLCGKGSRTSTDLSAHLRTHTGEKPFECKIPNCDKKYKTHSQLSAHLRAHTGKYFTSSFT